MQVILLERVQKLGEIGSIVTVKDGFGRNFLIPRKKAIRATKANIEFFETRKEHIAQENQERKTGAEQMLGDVDNLSITLIRQAGEDGRLYGSVSTKDIATAISDKIGKEFFSDMVILNNKFKEIGVYQIGIQLHSEVNAQVRLIIARSPEEANTVLEKHLKNNLDS